MSWGKIYETTWWGVGVNNNISWGIVYKDLAGDEIQDLIDAFELRVTNNGGTLESTECLRTSLIFLTQNP